MKNSPRREPWGRGHPPHAQPRQGRQRLLPDIPLVVRDPMRLQEGEEFLLQGNRAVVLLLVANILHHRGDVGWADAEGAVPHLPSEGRPMPSLVDPQGRVRFDQPQRFSHRERRGKRQETVNMVGPGVRVHQLTVDIRTIPPR